MKTIQYINAFAVGLPLVILMTYPIIKEGAFIYALLATIVTGVLQFLIALRLLFDDRFAKPIYIYFVGVVLFFVLWKIYPETNFYQTISYFIYSLPPLLALYLSVLIHKIK
ncbi:hypothetical protein [Flavobacterium foetidum]|uniref:hypothetical protein n=1 Tax=Flavobacterium foetidum TaxID=2026681 RepID=UPI0010757B12|nr:hypothetical protein [Flavobacterium foetidum]KAF2513434.1 hypothetical protein E0W73_14385 [Flavobacterium foetidum]